MDIQLFRSTANRPLRCSLCSTIVLPGEIFWRASNGSPNDILWLCTNHIPVNTGKMICEPVTEEQPYQVVRSDCLNVAETAIRVLIADWNAVCRISADAFEEVVCDRLFAMGLQAFRTGRANKKDGGIDIILWTPGPLRTLGAVQVKHRQSPGKPIGPDVVRDFVGVLTANQITLGIIATNSEFTNDAKWYAQQKTSLIQLRDGDAIKSWINDDFSSESWNTQTRTIELCPGVDIQVPQFL